MEDRGPAEEVLGGVCCWWRMSRAKIAVTSPFVKIDAPAIARRFHGLLALIGNFRREPSASATKKFEEPNINDYFIFISYCLMLTPP